MASGGSRGHILQCAHNVTKNWHLLQGHSQHLGKQNLLVAVRAVAALAPTVGSVLEPSRILTGTLLSQELRAGQSRAPIFPPQQWSPPDPCSPTALSLEGAGPRHKRWEQGSCTAQGTARPFQSHPRSSVASRELRGTQMCLHSPAVLLFPVTNKTLNNPKPVL